MPDLGMLQGLLAGGHGDAAARTLRPDYRAKLLLDAKDKYDDDKPIEHRERVIGHLEQPGHRLAAAAATQQRRHLTAIGDLKTRRNRL